MRLFVVFKVGVYRHECGGVFSLQGGAEASARRLLRGEPDDHHYYEVVPFTVDVASMQDARGDVGENQAVLKLRRVGGEIKEWT